MDGVRYLVSPFGESEWVRNLRKAGSGQLRGKATMEAFQAAELPAAQRSPIIAAYRKDARRGTSLGCPIPPTIPSSRSRRRAVTHRRANTADAATPNPFTGVRRAWPGRPAWPPSIRGTGRLRMPRDVTRDQGLFGRDAELTQH
ncbi:MAG: hypothetical protein ACXVRN_07170 [Solirubrobacteraceae bacterium]